MGKRLTAPAHFVIRIPFAVLFSSFFIGRRPGWAIESAAARPGFRVTIRFVEPHYPPTSLEKKARNLFARLDIAPESGVYIYWTACRAIRQQRSGLILFIIPTGRLGTATQYVPPLWR